MQDQTRIPSRTNLALAAVFTLLQLFFYVMLPLLLQDNPAWAWTMILAILSTTSYWSLAHETFHGVFHPQTKWNTYGGRLLCILFGAPWSILRFGHLLHHRFNRSALDRTDLGESPVGIVKQSQYYFRLVQGLYLGELASNFLILMPKNQILKLFDRFMPTCDDTARLRNSLQRQILSARHLWQARLDALLILTLLAGSFSLYGDQWYWLLLILLGRGFFISCFDNAYHYGTGLSDRKYAYNLALPGWLSKAILHFNLHRVHHHYPTAPWSSLPVLAKRLNESTDGNYWDMSMKQFAGLIPLDKIRSK